MNTSPTHHRLGEQVPELAKTISELGKCRTYDQAFPLITAFLDSVLTDETSVRGMQISNVGSRDYSGPSRLPMCYWLTFFSLDKN